MSVKPIHWVHIYRRPKQAVSGTAGSPVYSDYLQARYPAYDYKHKIASVGGFDTAKFALAVRPLEGQYIQDELLGCRVAVFVDSPTVPIWEGIINRISRVEGAVKVSRSIDDMANRVQVSFFSGGTTQQTAEVNSAASIALYASKSGTFDLNNQNTSGLDFSETVREKLLAELAFPQLSRSPADGSNDGKVEVECIGFYQTLGWDSLEINDTNNPSGTPPSTLEAASVIFARQVFGTAAGTSPSYAGYNSSNTSGNGRGVFYDSVDFSQWDGTNSAFTRTSERQNGQTALQFIQELVEAGDGVNPWVFGIAPTDPNTKRRRIYYRAASNSTVKYITDPAGTKRLYTPAGRLVLPWRVEADCLIRIAHRTARETDNDTIYVQSVQYDGETGEVTWASREDLTLEGVLQANRRVKSTDSLFGPAPRQFT